MDERVQTRTVKILQRRAQYLARIKSIKRRVKNKIAQQKRISKKLSRTLKIIKWYLSNNTINKKWSIFHYEALYKFLRNKILYICIDKNYWIRVYTCFCEAVCFCEAKAPLTRLKRPLTRLNTPLTRLKRPLTRLYVSVRRWTNSGWAYIRVFKLNIIWFCILLGCVIICKQM